MYLPNHYAERDGFEKRARADEVTDVSAEQLWQQIAVIGGENGWYYLNWLWLLRSLVDWCVGGVGMRHSKRDPVALSAGDVIDFWRVVSAIPGKSLTLLAEMKLPGTGVLEFELTPAGVGLTRVTVSAYFQPSNRFGRLYWGALRPVHDLIFRGLAHAIVQRARAQR